MIQSIGLGIGLSPCLGVDTDIGLLPIPRFLVTEDGDSLITEDGDRFMLEDGLTIYEFATESVERILTEDGDVLVLENNVFYN